jgi:DHA2 family multidrug resistance protein-like MFS transporter
MNTAGRLPSTMDGLPPERRRWAVLTLCISAAMVNIDLSMVNIALPTIARELHVSAADAVWIVNSFQFAVTFALIPVAGLADIVGYLNIYLAGLVCVAVAAIGAATAHSLLPLALARVVHGLGAACLTTASDALNRVVFPRAMLGRATGIAATAVAIGVLAGPVVGGAILSVAPWPAIFWINVPFAVVMLAAAPRVFPNEPGAGGRYDGVSAGLGAIALGAFVVALGAAGHRQALPIVSAELAVAFGAGWLFVRRQLGMPAPVIAIDLFAQPVFLLSFIASVAAFVAQTLAYVALPFLFQTLFERSVFESGMLTVPWLIATGVTSPLAGHLSDRYDASLIGGLGLFGFAAGLVLLALLPPHATTLDIVWRMTLTGFAYGFFQAPNNRVILGATPRERSAAASGIKTAARLIGQTGGASLAALAFTITALPGTANGTPSRTAVTVCLLVAAALAALAAGASAGRFRGRAEISAS